MIENICIWIAWHLPMNVAQWAFIRVATLASVRELSDMEMGNITIQDVIRTWK